MVLNEGSCWTIIGVEAVEFTFNQALACAPTPITPFPVVAGLEVRRQLWMTPPPPTGGGGPEACVPAGERWRTRGHAGAPRGELQPSPEGLVWERGDRHHVQVGQERGGADLWMVRGQGPVPLT